METAASFTSRRPAAGALPAFTLPPPTSDIPKHYSSSGSKPWATNASSDCSNLTPQPQGASDGISPALSSVNTASSQSSQPTNMQYTYGGGHVHGSWPAPGNSTYNVASTAQQQQPHIGQAPAQYGTRPSLYGQQPNMPYSHHRSSQSPATGNESLPAPPYDQVHQPFQTPVSGGGQGPPHATLPSTQHPPTSSAGPGHIDAYSHARPQSNTSYYSSSPYHPQQSPTQPSAVGTASNPRTLSSMAGSGSGMAPPASFRSYGAPYQQMPGLPGPILSNMHQPGAQMSMLPGMGVPPGYGPTSMLYGAGPAPPTERPFKCDQCTQSFSRNHDLKRHKRIHLSVKPFPCTFCSKSFSRKDALKRHRLVKGCETKARDGTLEDGAEKATDTNGEEMKKEA